MPSRLQRAACQGRARSEQPADRALRPLAVVAAEQRRAVRRSVRAHLRFAAPPKTVPQGLTASLTSSWTPPRRTMSTSLCLWRAPRIDLYQGKARLGGTDHSLIVVSGRQV